MRTALLVLALLATPALAAQTVWKWVDAKGVVHYSDRPMPGAERVEINVGTTGTVTTPQTAPPPPVQPPARDTGPAYRTFVISVPANDQVFINTGGKVDVGVLVEPELGSEHRLTLYLDGRAVQGFPQNTQQFSLADVPRGTHSVHAVITDARGRSLAETPTVTFHVRQQSVLNPNRAR